MEEVPNVSTRGLPWTSNSIRCCCTSLFLKLAQVWGEPGNKSGNTEQNRCHWATLCGAPTTAQSHKEERPIGGQWWKEPILAMRSVELFLMTFSMGDCGLSLCPCSSELLNDILNTTKPEGSPVLRWPETSFLCKVLCRRDNHSKLKCCRNCDLWAFMQELHSNSHPSPAPAELSHSFPPNQNQVLALQSLSEIKTKLWSKAIMFCWGSTTDRLQSSQEQRHKTLK